MRILSTHPKAIETRNYRARNPETTNLYNRLYKRRRKESGKRDSLEWYYRNKEQAKDIRNKWLEKNRDHVNQVRREKRQSDINTRIRQNLGARLTEIIRQKGHRKSVRTMELLGCTRAELMAWLESKFVDGMSWENYGYRGWHIDHVRPCASFDLSTTEQQRACFHFSNLQPLWWHENLSKKAKWEVAE